MAASLASNKGPRGTVSGSWMRWLETSMHVHVGVDGSGTERLEREGWANDRSKGPMSSVDAKKILSKCWWSSVRGGGKDAAREETFEYNNRLHT